MFIIRVYGILIYQNAVLVSDEIIKGKHITKFPGGGLEFGEGLIDCLKREIREELRQEATILNHFYTTDFFVPSAFNPQHQVISVYYSMIVPEPEKIAEMKPGQNDILAFRWIKLSDLLSENLSLVIDQKVASMLLKEV